MEQMTMDDTQKTAFDADAAEEYFSDLLTFYRNTANDIFCKDNDGRDASNQIYSAEYMKWQGMQIAMREVLEYFSKFDLCEWIHEIPKDRLREIAAAERDGRIKILQKPEPNTCGSCGHFRRIAGTCLGTCEEQAYYKTKRGEIELNRGTFKPSQSRKACKQYIPASEPMEG